MYAVFPDVRLALESAVLESYHADCVTPGSDGCIECQTIDEGEYQRDGDGRCWFSATWSGHLVDFTLDESCTENEATDSPLPDCEEWLVDPASLQGTASVL